MSFIGEVEGRIVERLKSQIQYADANSIVGVTDAKSSIDIDNYAPPAFVVEYSGESTEDQKTMGGRQLYRTLMRFDVYAIADSFSSATIPVEGQATTPQAPGIYEMIEDVFGALAGYQLNDLRGGQAYAQVRPQGVQSWAVYQQRVIYRCRFDCPVTRFGTTVT